MDVEKICHKHEQPAAVTAPVKYFSVTYGNFGEAAQRDTENVALLFHCYFGRRYISFSHSAYLNQLAA